MKMSLVDKINETMKSVNETCQCDYFLESKDNQVYCGLIPCSPQLIGVCKYQDNILTPLKAGKNFGYYWGCKIFNEPEGKRL